MEKLNSLNQIEGEILKIAEQLIKNNKILDLKKLQNTAKKKLGYLKEEISQAIYSLIMKKLLFPRKKLTISNVLVNKKREKILNYIYNFPGAHLREIRNVLNLNPKVTNWHLKVLEDFEFIYRKKYLNYRVFFPSDFPKGYEEPLLSLRNDNALLIFTNIVNHPKLNFEQLKSMIDLSPNTIKYHLENMISSGIISSYEEYGNHYFKINSVNFSQIQKYYTIEKVEEEKPQEIPVETSISDELSEMLKSLKEETQKPLVKKEVPITLEPPPHVEKESPGLIQVKREYDYIGGEIRFKIAVQNISNIVVTDINIILIPTTQYEIIERVKIVNVLRPGESRGVDFDLVPLTCGKSQVFGSVSFIDPFGKLHTSTIAPKEIWIKCPLVKPKRSTISEIEHMKKELQKGSARIMFKIKKNSAFNIVIDQISALDLSEIVINNIKFMAIYSGIAKVTNDNMIIESKIIDNEAILTVWTKDMKQATGFLAYLKNLIQMAFETAFKVEGRTEKVSQKILDLNEIIQRFSTLFDYCEGNWNISDILIILREIKAKIDRSFPSLFIIEKINDLIEDLENNYKEGEIIPEKIAIELEFKILNWSSELNRIACNNLDTYKVTFPEQKTQIEQLCLLIDEKSSLFIELKEKYIKRTLQYLMIIDKSSGLTIYEYNFTKESIDPDLISGFLTAIQSFGSEISKEETSITKLAYKNFEIALDDGEIIRAALILKGQPIEEIIKKIKHYIYEFEMKFNKELKNWGGNIGLFKSSSILTKKIFS
ncbi:MAG: winged helix-turn-helix transcriptional regulator [Candidatus Helarchaeota archaeon]